MGRKRGLQRDSFDVLSNINDKENVASHGQQPSMAEITNQHTSSATTTKSEFSSVPTAQSPPMSNVERFWADERKRQGRPAAYILANQRRKKTTQPAFRPPPDSEAARQLWMDLKADIEKQWKKFQYENRQTSSHTEDCTTSGKDMPFQTHRTDSEWPRDSSGYAFTHIAREDFRRDAMNQSRSTATSTAEVLDANRKKNSDVTTNIPEAWFTQTTPLTDSQLQLLTIKELIRVCHRHRINTAGCFEKQDLIARVRGFYSLQQHREEVQQVLVKQREEADRIAKEREESREQTVRSVETWASNKSIKQMLNDLSGAKIGSNGYIKRTDTFSTVQKAYRKCLLKIHPDKHMADGENDLKHLKATEVFKYVTEAFNVYKRLHDAS